MSFPKKQHLAIGLVCCVSAAWSSIALAQTGDVPAPPAEGPPTAGQANPVKHDSSDHGDSALGTSPVESDAKGKLQNDGSFEQEAAMSGLTEIGASQVALKRAQDPKIRSFAKTMIADHQRVSAALKPVAAGKKIVLPTMLDAKHQSIVDKLDKLEAKDFDKAYVQQMVSDHDEAVMFFGRYEMEASDPALKTFISKSLPTLKHHLAMAKALYGIPPDSK